MKVEPVASFRDGDLVVIGGEGPVDTSDVGGAGANVNDDGTCNLFNAVSGSEGFGDHHDGVHLASEGGHEVGLVREGDVAWRTDDAEHLVVFFGVHGFEEVGHERLGSGQVGFVVLGDTGGHGAVEVAGELVLEGVFAEQDISTEEVSGHGVLWSTDNGLNRVQFSSARSDG